MLATIYYIMHYFNIDEREGAADTVTIMFKSYIKRTHFTFHKAPNLTLLAASAASVSRQVFDSDPGSVLIHYI